MVPRWPTTNPTPCRPPCARRLRVRGGCCCRRRRMQGGGVRGFGFGSCSNVCLPCFSWLGAPVTHSTPPPPHPSHPLLAVYEASRALTGYLTPDFDDIQRVSACPGGVATGYTYFLPMVRWRRLGRLGWLLGRVRGGLYGCRGAGVGLIQWGLAGMGATVLPTFCPPLPQPTYPPSSAGGDAGEPHRHQVVHGGQDGEGCRGRVVWGGGRMWACVDDC